MHLEHQIEYEAHALRLMEGSGRTPKVLYVDGSKNIGAWRSGHGIPSGSCNGLSYRIDAGSPMSGRHSQCPDSESEEILIPTESIESDTGGVRGDVQRSIWNHH